MTLGPTRPTIALLCITFLGGCWRMQDAGYHAADGDDTSDTDDSDGITDPDTGLVGEWDWTAMESPTTKDLAAIWGTSFGNIYAVGEDGVIVHFDGTGWSHVAYDSPTKPNLHTIEGASDSQIWAAGANRFMLEFDGEQWEPQDTVFSGPEFEGGYRNLCVKSAMDAIVVGEGATIAEFSGSGWSYGIEAALDADFHAVTCQIGSNAFVAGHDHTAFSSSVLIRYDDWSHDWETMSHEPSDNMYGITGDQDGNAWAVGFDDGVGSKLYRLNEGGWSVNATSPHELLGMWAHNVLGVWAVGNTADDDAIAAIQAWTPEEEPQFQLEYDGTARLRGVWGVDNGGDRHVFAVGKDGVILHLFWSPV
jgi:hypothetical protein